MKQKQNQEDLESVAAIVEESDRLSFDGMEFIIEAARKRAEMFVHLKSAVRRHDLLEVFNVAVELCGVRPEAIQ